MINGLLIDLAKLEFADSVATLQLAPYIAELRRLNDRYAELAALRDKSRSVRTENVTSKELSSEAQDLLDDMCALANASSLLQPSEEAARICSWRDSSFRRYEPPTSNVPRARPLDPPNPARRSPVGEGIRISR